MRLASLDRASGHWLVATSSLPGWHRPVFGQLSDLAALPDWMRVNAVGLAVIDVPIGMAQEGERPVDLEARALLGKPRGSSVFPAPHRIWLGCESWEEANQVSKGHCGKGISQQSFGISPGVRELDSWITPELQDSVLEFHPEVSFAILAKAPMAYAKRTPDGVAERLEVLRRFLPSPESLLERRLPGASAHDYLDVLVGLCTAVRQVLGESHRLGGDRDARGLRMEMIA